MGSKRGRSVSQPIRGLFQPLAGELVPFPRLTAIVKKHGMAYPNPNRGRNNHSPVQQERRSAQNTSINATGQPTKTLSGGSPVPSTTNPSASKEVAKTCPRQKKTLQSSHFGSVPIVRTMVESIEHNRDIVQAMELPYDSLKSKLQNSEPKNPTERYRSVGAPLFPNDIKNWNYDIEAYHWALRLTTPLIEDTCRWCGETIKHWSQYWFDKIFFQHEYNCPAKLLMQTGQTRLGGFK